MFEERIEELNQRVENEGSVREKRTYTVREIQNILEISRPSAYNLIKENLFRTVRIGGHIRISKASFDSWLDSQMA